MKVKWNVSKLGHEVGDVTDEPDDHPRLPGWLSSCQVEEVKPSRSRSKRAEVQEGLADD